MLLHIGHRDALEVGLVLATLLLALGGLGLTLALALRPPRRRR